MIHYTGQLSEILLEPYQNATLRVSLPAVAHPQPGQYMLVNQPGNYDQTFPLTCYPALAPSSVDDADLVTLLADVPAELSPGLSLAFTAPRGRPFSLPKNIERLLCWSQSKRPAFLLPFISQALTQSCSVVLLSDQELVGIPIEAEVQPLAMQTELIVWSQIFLVEISIQELDPALTLLAELPKATLKKGFVLLSGEFPCGGSADCGLCTIRAGTKDFLPCKTGPLLPLNKLVS